MLKQRKYCNNDFRAILFCLLKDDFLLRHYDKGPCKNKLGHSRASVIWHRTQVKVHVSATKQERHLSHSLHLYHIITNPYLKSILLKHSFVYLCNIFHKTSLSYDIFVNNSHISYMYHIK